jgi:ParB/RepB/Spo0J family partition protein
VEGLGATEVHDVPLEDVNAEDKPFQYRLSARIEDLKLSLAAEGRKEPIDLTGIKPYRIIDGYRRVEAFRSLRWSTAKALFHRGISDEEAHNLAFIKNVVRKNLSPMDKANAIFQARQRTMKSTDLHEYFGLSLKQLMRYEALLDFSSEIQNLLDTETISMGHAKVLSDYKVEDKDLAAWVAKIRDSGLSAKLLNRELKQTCGCRVGGKAHLILKKAKNGFRMYPFSVTRDAPQAEKDRIERALQEALGILQS